MTLAPRMTLQTQLVLRVMLAEPAAEHYGLQLCEETGLPSGTIYPIVARLEQARLGYQQLGRSRGTRHGGTPAAARTTGSPMRALSRPATPWPARTGPRSSLVPGFGVHLARSARGCPHEPAILPGGQRWQR